MRAGCDALLMGSRPLLAALVEVLFGLLLSGMDSCFAQHLHDTHTWFSCRDKKCMAMRALSIIAWAAAPSSAVPSSPPPGAGASDCHSSQRCQSAELATAHRPSQKSWAAFVRDSQDLAHTTKPAMAILVAALLVALPSPGLGHACSTPRRRLGSPSQRAGIRAAESRDHRPRKWVTCNTRNLGHRGRVSHS